MCFYVILYMEIKIYVREKGDFMVTVKEVADYLDEKTAKNIDFIICTFYELRIKKNLSKEDTLRFLDYSKIRLKNYGYKVFFTGQNYVYNNSHRTVQDNELMVAIKTEW